MVGCLYSKLKLVIFKNFSIIMEMDETIEKYII